ncbi:reticulocyte-binding protein homolog 2a [Cydia pomonella]|uniref:reticulocyte-binding protein homolog 2a n=1 Tax=Cydia pomonella TaxID=82600 RepID=UPI002ADE3B7B|nr:reticulocyte-binding protein homolog 2a [Cydia pomonella]
MEEILNKNIFDDRALLKLAPDYVPTNTLLRLEARRNMVKDSHIHGTFTYNHGQRKTTKLSKDQVKMNKEIEKLRNSFQRMNLKNEIMLRNNPQHKTMLEDTTVDKQTKTMNGINLCKDVVAFGDDNRRASNKCHANIKNINTLYEITESTHIEHNNEIIEEINYETAISVDYEIHTQIDDLHNRDIFFNLQEETAENDFNDLRIENSKELNVDTQMSDLQSVLIMMAINSNSNENDQPNINQTNAEIITEPKDLVLVSTSIENENTPDFLNITPLRIFLTSRLELLVKKYIAKWRKCVKKRKEYVAQQRQEAIKRFFEKLEKKKTEKNQPEETKSKLLARDYSTYQHRYKMQKHIIALQKAKLEEQNRLIDELKYNRIIEASKQSVDEMKEEVRRTYYELDRHLKPKIKLLSNELKIPDIEEPSLVLHCLKVPQFLQRMEKRAREREEKHAMIRERRKQMEEERIRMKQQAELVKLEMDKEEKLKRIKELREKRKKERMEAIRKKQYADRMRSLIVMADLHYERVLLAKYCIRPLKMLMELKRDNIEKAKAHYTFQLKKNMFLHWMFYTEDMWIERNYKAENFHRKKLLRKAFEAFKKNHREYVLKRQVAEDYYDLYVTQLVFRKLRENVAILKTEYEVKMQKATLYYNRNLQFKIITCWRTLPALNALKREQEARKARWREKVLQVVPDYMPPDE